MEPKSTASSSSTADDSANDWPDFGFDDLESFFDALDFLEVETKGIGETPAGSSTTAIDPPPPQKIQEAVSDSVITAESEPPVRSTARVLPPPPRPPPPPPPSSLLEIVADFMIRAILFQFSLLISSITFPIWILHSSFTLLTDPFGSLKKAQSSFTSRISHVWKKILDRIGIQSGLAKVIIRLFWGSFWAVYVCIILIGMFLAAFLGGGLIVTKLAEKPLQINEELNFDYTKPSPAALVPISSCAGALGFGTEKTGTSSVPANHKLRLTVVLNLPESDYNRKLGVFQVRAEFLSSTGQLISSKSQPCMLKFKSSQMHLLETFIKTGPLLTGYSSESQIIQVKIKELKSVPDPISCIKVILEQRAEFKTGMGIPEIYEGWLKLESDLPVLKRMIWTWRWTIFVWFSTGIFLLELLVCLVCCKSVVIPRTGGNNNNNNNWRSAG